MLEQISQCFVYIKPSEYMEMVSPKLVSNKQKRKKLIAWHDHNCKIPRFQDLDLCALLFETLSETIQGACESN